MEYSSGAISILSFFATIASILLFASPLEEIRKMKVTGNKRGQTILPIIFMWINCCLWGLYGGQVKVYVIGYVNFIGCCFSVYYLYVWLIISSGVERVQLILVLFGAGAFVGWTLVYANDFVTGNTFSGAVSHEVNYLPIFANIINVLMFASPLVQLVCSFSLI